MLSRGDPPSVCRWGSRRLVFWELPCSGPSLTTALVGQVMLRRKGICPGHQTSHHRQSASSDTSN